MRAVLALLGSLLALALPGAAHAQRATVTILAEVELQSYLGRPVSELTSAVLGQAADTRYGFEMFANGAHIGLIDLAQLGQARCSNNIGVSGSTMLVRDGVAIGTVTAPGTLLKRRLPPLRDVHEMIDGRFRRVAPDATPRDAPAPLPLADGVMEIATLGDSANTSPGTLRVVCREYPGGGSTEGAIQAAMLMPFIFIRPIENESREHALVHGAALYDAIALGAALPPDMDARAREARVRMRTHTGDGEYQIVTIDLGGRASQGVAQPRSVGYIGVRAGIVEWKAIDPTGNAMSDVLCRAADGRRGRVRPGCSSTGYYFP